jgi:diguanylate cyclase (GGDEF)-like protein
MALLRPNLRRLALPCLFCLSPYLLAVKPPPLAVHPYHPTVQSAGDVTCRYRLEGVQTKFAETNQPEAHYSSLAPGRYTFQVTCNSPELGQTFSGMDSFTVAAPWWQRHLAEIAGSGGLTLLVWGMLWSRYRDRREKQRLERAVEERSAELAQANRELQEVSLSDPLTGIRNRRFFQTMIEADASQAVRAYRGSGDRRPDHRDLLFFLLDVDHFKAVNDEYGHDAGDRVLVQIAQRLTRLVRESDFVIRWGGEEFLVVFRAAERKDGALLAARILTTINSEQFDLGNNRKLARSCSLGWAAFPWLNPACSDLSVDEVLRLADRGLYIAKQAGRNQAVGLVPSANAPALTGANVNVASGNTLSDLDKFHSVEQLFENRLVDDVRTSGETPAPAKTTAATV